MIDEKLGSDMAKIIGVLAGIGALVIAIIYGIVKLVCWIKGWFV